MFKYLMLFSFIVTAIPALSAPLNCKNIIDNESRLKCFDEQSQGYLKKDIFSSSDEREQQQNASQAQDYSLLNERWELEKDKIEYAFRAYKPVYFLPVFYSSNPNELPQTSNPRTTLTESLNLNHTESKLQLSFKTKLLNNLIGDNGDVWFGYTQSSRWQIYNGDESRPFRETNHEPEFMFVWRTHYDAMGFDGRLLSLSLNHQSNGQNEPLSRSWNRLILTLGFDRPNWAVLFRPWWRIPEASDEDDENPDIEDFVGRGELLIVHNRQNSHQISTQLRHSFKTSDANGSIKIEWSYPCFDRLRCHAQIFHGYGESLIDYNHKATYFGLGVALVEWF